MSRRHAFLLLGTLAVFFSMSASAEAPRPSLDEVLYQATAIAFGQVERIDRRSGRPLVTLDVEHVARGELPDVVTFYADPVGDYRLSAMVGRRLVVFLEPTHQESPPLQLVLAGAGALRVFSKKNESYVAVSRDGGMTLPAKWCASEVRYGRSECTAKLDQLLRHAGLNPFKPPERKTATFRVFLPRECESCQLEDQMAKSADPGGLDCGASATEKDSPEFVRCVREALREKKAFRVTIPLQGIDSQLERAFVSDGTRIRQFDFDSSIEGGGRCAARVERHTCEALEFPEGGGESIQCARPGNFEVLCSQVSTRVEKVSAPEEVSKLRCVEASEGGRYNDCVVLPTGEGQRKILPPAEGPDLLCYSEHGGLSCGPLP